jgi:hypothetical protein
MNEDFTFNQLQLWGTARLYTVETNGSVAFTDEVAIEHTVDEAKIIARQRGLWVPPIAWLNYFSGFIVNNEVLNRSGESLIVTGFDINDRPIFEPVLDAINALENNNYDDYRYLTLWLGRLAEGDERLVPDRYEQLLSITE